jgi:glycosyltransferase involved in cell wall biosynthesis
MDVTHMASAMERILTDLPLRQSLRRRGLNNVARFSWDESARRVSQRIDALLSQPRDRRASTGNDALRRESSSKL